MHQLKQHQMLTVPYSMHRKSINPIWQSMGIHNFQLHKNTFMHHRNEEKKTHESTIEHCV